MGREAAGLVEHGIGRRLDRRAAELERARAAGTTAGANLVGVGLDDVHLVHFDAETVGHDHLERRRVALAVARGPDPHVRAAVGADLDRGVLRGPATGGDLHIAGHADAEDLGVAPLTSGRLLGPQLAVAGQADGLVERFGVVTGVVVGVGVGVEREPIGRDEVHPAQLDRVDIELDGGDVHDPLEHRGGFGPTCSPVGADRRGVRGRRRDVDRHVCDVVGAVRHASGRVRHHRAEGRVGAAVGEDAGVQTGDPAVAAKAQLDPLHLSSAVEQRQHVLRACLHPAHRPVEEAGCSGHRCHLAVQSDLGTEPAADRGHHHPDAVRLDAQHRREGALDLVGHLGRRVDDEPVAFGHDRDSVALHRHRRQPLVHDPGANDDLGVGQGIVDVAVRLGRTDRQVRPMAFEQQRRAGFERGLGVGNRGQRPVVDDDQLRGVDGVLASFGQNHRDLLADESDLAPRQRRPHERGHQPGEAEERLQAEIIGGEDGHHARRRLRLGRVDAFDGGMGHRRPHEVREQHAVDAEIVDIAA